MSDVARDRDCGAALSLLACLCGVAALGCSEDLRQFDTQLREAVGTRDATGRGSGATSLLGTSPAPQPGAPTPSVDLTGLTVAAGQAVRFTGYEGAAKVAFNGQEVLADGTGNFAVPIGISSDFGGPGRTTVRLTTSSGEIVSFRGELTVLPPPPIDGPPGAVLRELAALATSGFEADAQAIASAQPEAALDPRLTGPVLSFLRTQIVPTASEGEAMLRRFESAFVAATVGDRLSPVLVIHGDRLRPGLQTVLAPAGWEEAVQKVKEWTDGAVRTTFRGLDRGLKAVAIACTVIFVGSVAGGAAVSAVSAYAAAAVCALLLRKFLLPVLRAQILKALELEASPGAGRVAAPAINALSQGINGVLFRIEETLLEIRRIVLGVYDQLSGSIQALLGPRDDLLNPALMGLTEIYNVVIEGGPDAQGLYEITWVRPLFSEGFHTQILAPNPGSTEVGGTGNMAVAGSVLDIRAYKTRDGARFFGPPRRVTVP